MTVKYIWSVTLEEQWDYEDEFSEEENEYTIAAGSYDEAIKKADGVAKKKSFLDEKPEGDGKIHRVVKTRLTKISRGDEIDA